jgi:hypothetical protein
MSTDVVYFDSTMGGAPSLDNTPGSLITVLDATLVNGFGVGTLDTLAVVDDVATATISAGHGLAMIGNTGPVIRISGIVGGDAALNGDWRVASVPTSTTFTFATSGITNTTVNTVACKRKPAGFEKAFSGTNLAAYRSLDIEGTQLYCRIDDTGTTNARIRGYESMSDVDTGTGLFPTDAQISGGGYIYKANGTNRTWTLFSDGQAVYFFCDASGNNLWSGGFVFCDINSYCSPDAYRCLLVCSTGAAGAFPLYLLSNISGSYLARSYTQLGESIASARYSHGRNSGLGAGGQTYPAPADNRIHLWPVECWEGTSFARGMMPGAWNPIHNGAVPHGLVIDDIPQLPDRTLLAQTVGAAAYECAIDITGPWRS